MLLLGLLFGRARRSVACAAEYGIGLGEVLLELEHERILAVVVLFGIRRIACGREP